MESKHFDTERIKTASNQLKVIDEIRYSGTIYNETHSNLIKLIIATHPLKTGSLKQHVIKLETSNESGEDEDSPSSGREFNNDSRDEDGESSADNPGGNNKLDSDDSGISLSFKKDRLIYDYYGGLASIIRNGEKIEKKYKDHNYVLLKLNTINYTVGILKEIYNEIIQIENDNITPTSLKGLFNNINNLLDEYEETNNVIKQTIFRPEYSSNKVSAAPDGIIVIEGTLP
ncbi:hypothetical protein [Geomicrobium sp. JCM 19055]|uniref:hypothetical protein n=1 Tax=Geomicrobium sp. JCM 19055 TaxID=1460649 RepID=UPI00045EDA28|nr:hypothetical protein [Geomicrobium sp. JCM 19055]GAJ99792.1 hypothetical protein JCM19055_2828 [Geomicrobium sp. JCM 19055]